MCLQDIIHCTDDELHDRSWSIKYAPLHTEFTIILAKEVFIEMDNWVVRLFLIHAVHECVDIRMSKHFTEFIDDIFEAFLVSFSRNMVEKSTEQGIRFWDEVTSFTSRECFVCLVVITRDKESVDKSLSIEICEVFVRKIM
jgi:hypothetical protein